MPSYVIGVDFGTESGRAVVIDPTDGRELGSSVYPYANGVIDETLPAPDTDVRLAPEWALQDPEDYLRTFQQAIPAAIAAAGVDAGDVIGVGIDFTACTMLPAKADGTPLATLPEFRRNPHAWVKLWKHHAAQPEADLINATARERGEDWLPRYGGKISSEWFYSKALQILDEAPEIYDAADRLIEAADWAIWRLTGNETRNSCTAGYKAIWSKAEGFPDEDYFAALDPRLATVVDEKMSRDINSIGEKAGELTEEAAAWTGLRPGTAVAVANVDAHVSVPAVTVTEPGRMVMVMGTSTCHLVLGEKTANVEGMCGVVEDGILPGLFGYEAGQSGVGDIFAWFVDNLVPAEYFETAEREGLDVHQVLEREAARLAPGQSGLVALDWVNGNRSILVDVDLSGLILGATMATKAHEVYRALIESTAFGTRKIIESFEACGRAHQGHRGLWRPARQEQAADADLRRCHRAGVLHRGLQPGTRPWLGDVGSRGCGGCQRRLRHHRGRHCRHGPSARRALRARAGGSGGVRRALCRVRAAARLLRAWRQRRHEAAAGDPRSRPGGLAARPAWASSWFRDSRSVGHPAARGVVDPWIPARWASWTSRGSRSARIGPLVPARRDCHPAGGRDCLTGPSNGRFGAVRPGRGPTGPLSGRAAGNNRSAAVHGRWPFLIPGQRAMTPTTGHDRHDPRPPAQPGRNGR